MFFCFISFIIVCICNVFIKYAFKQILLLCSNRKLKLQTKKIYIKKTQLFQSVSVVAVIIVINIIDFLFA